MGWRQLEISVNTAQYKIIYLLKTLWNYCVYVCVISFYFFFSNLAAQFLFLKIYSSVMYYIPIAVSPPSPPPHLSPQIHYSFICLQKRAGLPWISTKDSMSSHSKNSHMPMMWWGNPEGGKGSQKHAKESETSLAPTVRSPTRASSYTAITYMERT